MRSLLLSLLVLFASSHLFAETLLSNTFDKNIGNWTVLTLGTGVLWSPMDSAGLSSSGSLEIIGPGYVQQCLPVTDPNPITNWTLSGKARVSQVANLADDVVEFKFSFYETSDCTLGADFVDTTGFGGLSEKQWKVYMTTHALNLHNIRSALFTIVTQPSSIYPLYFDDLLIGTNVSATTPDLRFSTTTVWKTPENEIGFGHPVNVTSEAAFFYFFSPANIEVFVKILNGCGLNNEYWLFAAGLTNVEVTLGAVDNLRHAENGEFYPQGRPFYPLQNTEAFPTCP